MLSRCKVGVTSVRACTDISMHPSYANDELISKEGTLQLICHIQELMIE